MNYSEIEYCRICGSKNFKALLNLGWQFPSGIFPSKPLDKSELGPLELVKCENCQLVQLKQTYNLSEMYGLNYGYHSSLNNSMIDHLKRKVEYLQNLVGINKSDIILDIGSNDATTLSLYSVKCQKIGIDPTGIKFSSYYPDYIELITDFFPSNKLSQRLNGKKIKLITSISMFYDLPDPKRFVENIAKYLDLDGVWHLEQSYLPLMLKNNSFDTICHEHLEYYSLSVINNLLTSCGLRILNVSQNDINGGSLAIDVCHAASRYKSNNLSINWYLDKEFEMQLNTDIPFTDFLSRVSSIKNTLSNLLLKLKIEGKKVFGFGASTKGNTLLQFFDITSNLIPFIAEVNEDKFGKYTPGTNIKIISQDEAVKLNPDYFLVLPWHFKNFILNKERDILSKGIKFIFPLPEVQIY